MADRMSTERMRELQRLQARAREAATRVAANKSSLTDLLTLSSAVEALSELLTEVSRFRAAQDKSAAPGNSFYGWFDDAEQEVPSYDPPHDGPCLFCGRLLAVNDVRTHSIMVVSGYANRSYFYRTHRTCAETDPSHTAMDGVVFDMIARNGD